MQMTENNILKTYKDYMQPLYDKWPNIPPKDLDRIVKYGWQTLFKAMRGGVDFRFESRGRVFYFARLFVNNIAWYTYYIKKLCKRFHFLYTQNRIAYGSTYYFSVNEEQYKKYLKRKRFEWTEFQNITLYRIPEECELKPLYKKEYMFRYSCKMSYGRVFRFPKKKVYHKEITFLKEIEKPKGKDILISTGKYDRILKWRNKTL